MAFDYTLDIFQTFIKSKEKNDDCGTTTRKFYIPYF
jgi:hypothetical protein